MPDYGQATNVFHTDTLVELMRDVHVCVLSIIENPNDSVAIDQYVTTLALLYDTVTGDKMTLGEAKYVFYHKVSPDERKRLFGA